MRNRYFHALLVLLIGLAFVWNTCRRANQNETQDSKGKEVNPKAATDKSTNQANRVENNESPTRLEKIRDFFQNADTCVDFYGRVIDQDGKAVEGAIINYRVERVGSLMADGKIANNNQKATCISASDGSFSIKGASGLTLSINLIEKGGYRDGGQNVRSFGYKGIPKIHNADLKKPVDFLLISNNIPKTRKLYDKRLTFSWNQGPVEIPIPSVGKITIIPKRDWEPDQLRNFDWQVEISMEGAEFAKIEMGQAKIAPKEGYQKSFKYGSNKGDLQWAGGIQQHYAFRTTSGFYGFMDFDLSVDREDGAQSTTLEVRLNETGSRSLD